MVGVGVVVQRDHVPCNSHSSFIYTFIHLHSAANESFTATEEEVYMWCDAMARLAAPC